MVLGGILAEALDKTADQLSLVEILEQAIAQAVEVLSLGRGARDSASCTVALARFGETDTADLLVLGDSTIAVGGAGGSVELITDTRLDQLDLPEADAYKARLREGFGYDETHRRTLSDLQKRQQYWRNRPGGYWIASTEPAAARHALTMRRSAAEWFVLATDGASDCLEAAGISWQALAQADDAELANLLRRCQAWEAAVDPHGIQLSRAKRHDDKTVVTVRRTQPRKQLS
ncbi:protein phosphatase 2C family protein [Nocardia colli]|uniref:Protein phosphatase 2C family protein n=1 Tax=Nocardia colli TaxID=2545717 RepID=A0A5N0ENL2_9NOCA|nr:PP2C family serine/threonine-protein phosphatase [Nocardia colli]KAA8889884.1 protein phosphatase 2C family protein [Nocardia colli]